MWPRLIALGIGVAIIAAIATGAYIKGIERGVDVQQERHQQEIEAIYNDVEGILEDQQNQYDGIIRNLLNDLEEARALRQADQQREEELHDRIRSLNLSLSEIQGRIYETTADVGYCNLTPEFDRMFADASRERHTETGRTRQD